MQTQAHTANRAQRRAKPAKAAAPRNIDPVAGLRTLHNCRPFEDGAMVHEHIQMRMCFDALRNGAGTESDFDRISMVLNVGLVRAEQIDDLLVQTMQSAQNAMLRMQARVLRGLPFGFDAGGLQDLPVAMDAYEAILNASSPAQMMCAMHKVWARMGCPQQYYLINKNDYL